MDTTFEQQCQHAKELCSQFIKEYYTRFKSDPMSLKHMYNSTNSVFCHTVPGQRAGCVTGSGVDAELARIAATYQGCRISVASAESMPSCPQANHTHGGGVLIMVTGRVLLPGSHQDFHQSFLLAPIGQSYYIHNDCMNLGDVVQEQRQASPRREQRSPQSLPEERAAPPARASPPSPAQRSPPQQPQPVREAIVTPVPQGESPPLEDAQEDAAEDAVYDDTLEQEMPLDEDPGPSVSQQCEDQDPADLDDVEQDAPPLANSRPLNYADAVAKSGRAPAQRQPTRVVGGPTGAPAAGDRAQRAARGDADQWGQAQWGDKKLGGKVDGEGRQPRGNGRKGDGRGAKREGQAKHPAEGPINGDKEAPAKFAYSSLYVTKIPEGMREQDAEEVFSQFGVIKGKTFRPQQGYCFIDFGEREAMRAAIDAGMKGNVEWRGQSLKVEERKSPEQRGQERERGQGKGGGKGGQPSTRGGKGGGRGGRGQRGGGGGGDRAPRGGKWEERDGA